MTSQIRLSRSTAMLRLRRASFLTLTRRILAIRKQRQNLRALDKNALNDIGLTRSVADAEASRPVWDVPAGWQR